jgi:hypothetical protein
VGVELRGDGINDFLATLFKLFGFGDFKSRSEKSK